MRRPEVGEDMVRRQIHLLTGPVRSVYDESGHGLQGMSLEGKVLQLDVNLC